MAEIKLEHLKKRYMKDGSFAVKDFNLEIKNNEFIVLVGPSGCGKSTTLRMIAGLEDISEGSLYIDDQKVNDFAPKDRDIAMVFQNYALYPHMTVYGNMSFGLRMRRFKKDEIHKRVMEAAKVLGLEEFLKRKPKALSGGQRQRVALGRAMVRNPKVFLMDEPLSNLDAKLRVQMRSEIAKLHRQLKTTTVYVTHDQTEAMTMADRIVIMKLGEIQQIGTPKEVYDNPANLFVASFMGSPAMNFLPAFLSDSGLTVAGHIVNFPTDKIEKLRELGYQTKEFIAGIRPEDIQISSVTSDSNSNNEINATIDVAELLGSEMILYFKIAETPLIIKTTDLDYQQGEKVFLTFNLNKLRLFDKKTENLII